MRFVFNVKIDPFYGHYVYHIQHICTTMRKNPFELNASTIKFVVIWSTAPSFCQPWKLCWHRCDSRISGVLTIISMLIYLKMNTQYRIGVFLSRYRFSFFERQKPQSNWRLDVSFWLSKGRPTKTDSLMETFQDLFFLFHLKQISQERWKCCAIIKIQNRKKCWFQKPTEQLNPTSKIDWYTYHPEKCPYSNWELVKIDHALTVTIDTY